MRSIGVPTAPMSGSYGCRRSTAADAARTEIVTVDPMTSLSDAARLMDEHATAHALLQATNGLLPYSLSTTELGERDEVEQRASDVANLMLRGLLSRK